MAADPIDVVLDYQIVEYDGTNSADIANLINLNTISEGGGSWTFQSPPNSNQFTINAGEFVYYTQEMALRIMTQAEVDFELVCNATCDALDEAISGVTAPAVRSVGVAPVPTLLLNQSAVVPVTLDPAMADSSYTAKAQLFAGVALGASTITNIAVVDADTVNVTVQSGVASLVGANVIVYAID